MSEQLTLEKLKIDQRLTTLEIQSVERSKSLSERLDSIDNRFASIEKKLDDNFERVNHMLLGNGSQGLIDSIRELKEKDCRKDAYVKIVLIAVIGLVAKTVWDIIIKHGL